MGLTPRVLPSNARTFPAPAGARFVHVNPPPLFPPLPSAGCEPEIEIFLVLFSVFFADNAFNMCPDSLYVVFETSPRFSPDVPECDPSHHDDPRAPARDRAQTIGQVRSPTVGQCAAAHGWSPDRGEPVEFC